MVQVYSKKRACGGSVPKELAILEAFSRCVWCVHCVESMHLFNTANNNDSPDWHEVGRVSFRLRFTYEHHSFIFCLFDTSTHLASWMKRRKKNSSYKQSLHTARTRTPCWCERNKIINCKFGTGPCLKLFNFWLELDFERDLMWAIVTLFVWR